MCSCERGPISQTVVFSRRVFLFRQEFSFSQSYRLFPSFCQALAEDRVTTPTKKKTTLRKNRLLSCLISGMDESCDFPWIYNVSNGFTVIWVFGQFRWSPCNKLALFSYCKSECYHLLGTLLEPSLPSRVEREETLNATFMGGLFGKTRTSSATSSTAGANTAAAGGNASTAGRSGEGRKEPKAYHLQTHRQPPFHTNHAMPHHQELATAAAAAVGGWVAGGTKDMGGISEMGSYR